MVWGLVTLVWALVALVTLVWPPVVLAHVSLLASLIPVLVSPGEGGEEVPVASKPDEMKKDEQPGKRVRTTEWLHRIRLHTANTDQFLCKLRANYNFTVHRGRPFIPSLSADGSRYLAVLPPGAGRLSSRLLSIKKYVITSKKFLIY